MMYLVVKSDQEFVGFNRTFMELKYKPLRERSPQKTVLIVPLWN